MAESSWEDSLKEWGLLDACYAAALGMEESELFAAVADDTFDDPWAALYADDYEVDMTQEDGSSKKVTINEWSNIADVFANEKTSPLYLAGQKYLFCKRSEEGDLTILLAKRSKAGAVVVKTASGYYVIGLYDEEKEQSYQTAMVAITRFAESLG